jgi:DivIVA domain-containing protein
VRFSEQWRGYRTDEVDEFVEQVAEAFDQFERRLEEAAQRTALAERRLDERGPDDDLRRTLVLAQRTADAALEEAKVQAARMVADAEQSARSVLDALEVRRERIESEIEARISLELGQLHDRRAALEADVERLTAYVGNQRERLAEELRGHLEWLERAGPLEPLPSSPGAPSSGLEAHGQAHPDPDPEPDGEAASAETVVDAAELGAHLPAPEDEVLDLAGELPAVDHRVHDDDANGAGQPDDDTLLDDLDVIPWGDASADGGRDAGVVPDVRRDDTDDDTDDDPFIAELRRAVDDPEPLGPREESAEWSDDVDLYERHKAGPLRSRRRRRP